jgi:hypothetical protein
VSSDVFGLVRTLPVTRLIRQIQLFFTYRCNMSLVRSPHLHRTDVFEAAAPHRRRDITEYQPRVLKFPATP